MQLIEYRHIKNKKAKRLNLLKGSKPRNPSQTNGAANIQINLDTAIPNLRNVAQKYIGIVNPYGFLTELRKALGIPNSSGVSKYGKVTIPKDDGSVLQASLRVTNHQANADKYVEHNTNYEYNLSIVVRRKQGKNTFIPNDNVKLDEFVYYGNNLAKVENPLTQIVNSIIGFLQNGTYKDTTGVAFINQSPQQQEDSNNNQINENKTMKQKQTIRLTESQLHRVINESVKRVLNEKIDKGPINRELIDMRLSSMNDKEKKALENLYNEFGKQTDFYDWIWNITFTPASKNFDNKEDAVNFAQYIYNTYPFLTKPHICNINGEFEVMYQKIHS